MGNATGAYFQDGFKGAWRVPEEKIVIVIGNRGWNPKLSTKDINAVMAAQADLVAIEGVFKPVVVRMAGEENKHWEAE